ncbi:copper amine oxidase N-terminal domain-containing protein [Cohnella kolymensis]|uniref:copper amine oxidase N-terminal domain-containing protein n=1 Tax=Cohnella kolymensis TaxID=1590652 RepID=UPI00069786C7|nr:copper amine oxidase N-terminal domain-containing protein [Cohnella kolymensis]
MKSTLPRLKLSAISACLAAGLLAGSVISSYHSVSAAATASQAITIMMNGALYTPESNPYVSKGTVYLPLREISSALKAVVVWQSHTKKVIITRPDQTIVLTLGKATVTRNGAEVKLSATPIVKESHVYVPFRAAAEILGASVNWNSKSQTVDITHKLDFDTVIGVNSFYWLNRKNGQVFLAKPYDSQPNLLGAMNIDLQRFSTMKLASSGGVDQLIVEDYYGEPLLNTDVYTALIVKGAIVKQTKVHYWQRYTPNVTFDGRHQVMTDGKAIFLLDATGKLTKEYDLVAMTGNDETFSVEGIGQTYALVRPNTTGLLTLIDLETGDTTQIYKQLNAQEQEYAETNDVPYHGDHIKFESEKDGQLHFSYHSIFDNKDHMFSFKLK